MDTREDHAAGPGLRHHATTTATETIGLFVPHLITRSLTYTAHQCINGKTVVRKDRKHSFSGRLLIACVEFIWTIHRHGT